MMFRYSIEHNYNVDTQSIYYVPQRFYHEYIELDFENGLFRNKNENEDDWKPIPNYKEYNFNDFSYSYEYDYCKDHSSM